MEIYPVVRLATNAPIHSRYWSTHKEYCFSAIKSLPRTLSPLSPWSRVLLRSFSTKEGGLHVPRTKLVDAAPHQVGGSLTYRRVTKTPRMAGSLRYTFVHTRTRAQGSQSCSLTHSRAKLVLNLKMWSLSTWVGLEVFFNVSRISLNSSKLQMTRGPSKRTSRFRAVNLFLRVASDNPT